MKWDQDKQGNRSQGTLGVSQNLGEQFRHLINKSADGVLIVNLDGVVQFANPAACRLFRRSADSLIGESFGYPLTGGETTEIEILGIGGTVGVAEMRVVDVEWKGKGAFLSTLRDVTERNELQEKLRTALKNSEEARAEVGAILRSISEGLIVTDREMKILLMNRTAEMMLETACHEIAGRPLADLFPDSEIRRKILAGLDEQEGTTVDIKLPLSGGSKVSSRTVQARSTKVQNQEGRKIGMITILLDVTQERLVERMKSEFVSMAAHEFRSPLTSIVGFAELLLIKEDFGAGEWRKHVETIRRQGQKLADIVNTFLDLSLIEAGKGILIRRVAVRVGDLVRQAVSATRLPEDRLVLRTDLDEPTTPLFIDPQRIGQVLENLLDNAVKYSPGQGEILIDGRREGAWYSLSVRDRGIGMAAEEAARMFDMFYRADGSKTAPPGLGIGLSIARYIVEAHGGRIEAESSPGQGTTVSMRLPLEARGERAGGPV